MDKVEQLIADDPAFQALHRRRGRFNWIMSIIMLVVFYGYILLIAFAPHLLAIRITPDSVVTWGIPIGFSVIIISLSLIGIYVVRANRDFDPAIEAIIERAKNNAAP